MSKWPFWDSRFTTINFMEKFLNFHTVDDHSQKKQLYFNPFLWQDDEVSSLVLQQSFILNFFKVLPKTPLFQGQNPLLYKAAPALLTFFLPATTKKRLKKTENWCFTIFPFPYLIMVIFSNDFDHEEVQCGNLRIFLLSKFTWNQFCPSKWSKLKMACLC